MMREREVVCKVTDSLYASYRRLRDDIFVVVYVYNLYSHIVMANNR
jgi:hypothetical protein